MQKKLIALAVAGLVSGAAFAQSNVTIYGAINTTWEDAKATGATYAGNNVLSRARLASDASHIGFRGTEDLGGGMKALFQYESGFASDTAGGLTGGRDTYVGLTGGFGTVVAGYLTHPLRTMGGKVDFNPAASTSGFTGSMYGEFAGVKTGSDDRANNAVAYVSPSFSGFTVTAAWVNGENRNADGAAVSYKARQYQLAGQYENGPLYVGLGYHHAKDPQVDGLVRANLTAAGATTALGGAIGALGAGTYNDKLTVTRLAATYALPTNTKISFLWDKQKYDQSTNALATNAARTAYMIGVKQAFGANNVWLQYAVARDLTGAVCNAVSCGDTGAKQWTLGYSYSLSKRTTAQAFYTRLSNDKDAMYDNYVNSVGLARVNRGADTTVFGAGLRHTF